jgi:hypothetical protein
MGFYAKYPKWSYIKNSLPRNFDNHHLTTGIKRTTTNSESTKSLVRKRVNHQLSTRFDKYLDDDYLMDDKYE